MAVVEAGGFHIFLYSRTCAVSGRGLGHFGGEHLQDFNVSGFQEKNLPTAQACQAKAVNLCIAFGPRQNARGLSLKLHKSCSLFPFLRTNHQIIFAFSIDASTLY
jgi:hypothetical protein